MGRNEVYELCERIIEKGTGCYISEVVLSKDAIDAIIDCAVQEANELVWKQLNDLAERCEAIQHGEAQNDKV